MSKNLKSSSIVYKQVEQFRKINIVQISGIYEHILVLTKEGKVYSKGGNFCGQLGTGDKEDRLKNFVEISSLNRYKIVAVSAGKNHSLFLTSEGKVLACGDNSLRQSFNESLELTNVLPVETSFQKGAEFCISSDNSSVVCVGFDPEMSPNRRVKDEINILLLGCEKKTQILQAFVNNNFESAHRSDQEGEDYTLDLEIKEKIIKTILIDAKNTDNLNKRNEYYHRSINYLYFFDNSKQSASFNELNQIIEEARQVWNNTGIKLVFVNCINSNSPSPKPKYNEISDKYLCKIFEIDVDESIEIIDKPFFSFLPNIYEHRKDILKIGKEYRNPFNNINKDNINIGLFGSKNVNKTELAFRYIYGDLFKDLYDDFIQNFTDNNLEKIFEIHNKYFKVSVLDSSFVSNNNEDNFRSYYSVVQGIVFVFQIDLLSNSNFIDEINQFYLNAKDSVKDKFNLIVALKVGEKDQINDLYRNFLDKINQIRERFQCEVFLFSFEKGENVEDLFYCLIKEIIKNTKKNKESISKKKHQKKRKYNKLKQAKITKSKF